jgi:hypothetical protein
MSDAQWFSALLLVPFLLFAVLNGSSGDGGGDSCGDGDGGGD